MSECTHNCETCGENCSERKSPESFLEKPHELSNIKKVIGIVSGKGGVGKSLVTALCAVTAERCGYKTAILDADVTGPSVPKMFGLKEKAKGTELGLMPVTTKTGLKVMSLNLLTENETDPVVWRGPTVLDRRNMGRRGFYVYRYASGNGRRAADGVSVNSA